LVLNTREEHIMRVFENKGEGENICTFEGGNYSTMEKDT
jgi:hypothetical protein